MRLLTLDLANVFGWAFGDPDGDSGPIRSGSHELPDVPLTDLMITLESRVMDIVKGNEITDVLIEQPIIPMPTSFHTVTKLSGMALVAGMAARRCGAKTSLVMMQTWRSELGLPTQGPKNVLADPHYRQQVERKDGKGLVDGALKIAKRKYVKDQAIKFVIKKGITPKDDNEADAIAMWFWKKQWLQAKADARKQDLFSTLDI